MNYNLTFYSENNKHTINPVMDYNRISSPNEETNEETIVSTDIKFFKENLGKNIIIHLNEKNNSSLHSINLKNIYRISFKNLNSKEYNLKDFLKSNFKSRDSKFEDIELNNIIKVNTSNFSFDIDSFNNSTIINKHIIEYFNPGFPIGVCENITVEYYCKDTKTTTIDLINLRNFDIATVEEV